MFDLGGHLRSLRKSKGWTQKQLAAYIHRSAAAVGSYEQNAQTPPVDVLIMLSQIFHVTIDELLGIEQKTRFTAEALNEKQKEAIVMLMDEFEVPTRKGNELSQQQLRIERILMLNFGSESMRFLMRLADATDIDESMPN